MSIESINEDNGPVGVSAPADIAVRPVSYWPRVLLLAVALGGLVAAQGIAGWPSDPSGMGVKVLTAVMVTFSVVTMVASISSITTMAASGLRHVFSGRYILAFGIHLSVMTALVVGSLFTVLDPFDRLVARGQITAGDIADAGLVFGAVIGAAGAGTALLAARQALREERRWPDAI